MSWSCQYVELRPGGQNDFEDMPKIYRAPRFEIVPSADPLPLNPDGIQRRDNWGAFGDAED
jgi:hypothetical protein